MTNQCTRADLYQQLDNANKDLAAAQRMAADTGNVEVMTAMIKALPGLMVRVMDMEKRVGITPSNDEYRALEQARERIQATAIPEAVEARFRGIIDAIEYNRHGTWSIYLGKDGTRFYLQVQCSGSADGPWSGRKWFLSPWMVTSEVVRTAFEAIVSAETHEIQEKFTYKGANIYNPHMSLDDLVAAIDNDIIGVEARGNGMVGL